MPEYISHFLEKGIRLLIRGEGQDFLNEYYSYIEKIYNYQIPLRDIASKGKIKKTLKEYLKDVQTITKAGRPKSRQAWYELAIKHNLDVNPGDTIYYVNNGNKKADSDCKKVSRYFILDMFGEKVDTTKEIDKAWNAYRKSRKTDFEWAAIGQAPSDLIVKKSDFIAEKFPSAFLEEEIVLNCELLPREIIEKESDTFCKDVDESLEYNVIKYIEQFNNRIKPLLVCFSKDIRSQILITNPTERPYFTEEQCQLVSGQPNKETDQDTYEQLMTIEDKEIKFWTKYNMIPPFVKECGMDWDEIVSDYNRRMKEEEENGIAAAKDTYQTAIMKLTKSEIEDFLDDGTVPESILKVADVDPVSGIFVLKKFNIEVGGIQDIVDRLTFITETGEEIENDE